MHDAASHKWDACTKSWRYARLFVFTESRLHPLDDAFGDLLGVAEQHHGVVAVEQRIVDAGITR